VRWGLFLLNMQKKILNQILFLIVVIFFLNLLAMKFYWYWSIPWFDMLMHFLGGLFISLVLLWLNYFRGLLGSFSKKKAILIAILGTLVIGLLWEIFEFSLDTFITEKSWDMADTLSDLFFDLLGAGIGTIYYYARLKE